MMELENRHFVTSNEIINSGNGHQWMKLTNERLMGNFVAEGLGCQHLCHFYQLTRQKHGVSPATVQRNYSA